MKNKQLGIDFESLDNEENVNKENSTADTKNITFEKPKFLQEEKDNQITNAQKGTLTHLCLQKLKPKKEYNLEKIQTLIQNLEMNKIITEKEREAINPYKILQCHENISFFSMEKQNLPDPLYPTINVQDQKFGNN